MINVKKIGGSGLGNSGGQVSTSKQSRKLIESARLTASQLQFSHTNPDTLASLLANDRTLYDCMGRPVLVHVRKSPAYKTLSLADGDDGRPSANFLDFTFMGNVVGTLRPRQAK